MASISPERFIELRKLGGLTQEQMGNQLGVSAKYVGMIERGEKSVEETSSLGFLFQLQEVAAIGARPPAGGGSKLAEEGGTYRAKVKPPCRMVAVSSWAHAGEAASYEELPESWTNKIPTECRDEKAFAVQLEGDSMEPRFRDGDLLILMPSEEAYSGCFVVAKFLNDGVVFRRLERSGDRIQLVPLNERYSVTEHSPEEFSWIYPVWGRWSQMWKR